MITIFGAGAVGIALAVQLSRAGRPVTLVRLRRHTGSRMMLRHGDDSAGVPCCFLEEWKPLGNELLVITAKAFANETLAAAIARRGATGPVCLLQNGINIERPFLKRGFGSLCRGVLYVTGEAVEEGVSTLKAVKPSFLGRICGEAPERYVAQLSTPAIPFVACDRIEEEIWTKGIVNAVFNSICTLLEVDNGIFARCADTLALAREVVAEAVHVAHRLGIPVNETAILETVLQISRSSRHLISTLQDLRQGRPTEIEFLNLAIHELAQQLSPPVVVPRTHLLGELVRLKSYHQGSGAMPASQE